MIKRVSKNNDLKDIIKGYPEGVLDNIYDIKYYTSSEEEAIHPSFERKGDIIVCILPSQDLLTLDNGVLYRKAYYKEVDERFPDEEYNLEICDNMNIWLGEDVSTSPAPSGDYATKEYVNAKVEGLASEEYVDDALDGKQDTLIAGENITIVGNVISATGSTGGVTKEYVDGEIERVENEIPSLDGYATEQWVEGQGYLTEHQQLKTINGNSIIGEGNITIQGGGNNAYASITKQYPYYYDVEYNGLDYEYAKTHFAEPNVGGCSVVVSGSNILRNYDWKYDNTAMFTVTTNSTVDTHRVFGCASINGLTEELVSSADYSELYKMLPFYLQDGTNGWMFCAVNVVPSWHNNATVPLVETQETICNIMLVRYILDHFTSVNDAVNFIKAKMSVFNHPSLEAMDYELHWILKDKDRCVVLEIVNDSWEVIESLAMTNFHLYGVNFNEDGRVNTPWTAKDGEYPAFNNIEDYGTGLERWNTIIGATTYVSTIEGLMVDALSVSYSKAYQYTGVNAWYSEFVGGDITVNTPYNDEAFQARMAEYRQKYAERSRDTGETWYTVHSCIYTIEGNTSHTTIVRGLEVTPWMYYDFYRQTYASKKYVDEEIERVEDTAGDALNRAINANNHAQTARTEAGYAREEAASAQVLAEDNRTYLDINIVEHGGGLIPSSGYRSILAPASSQFRAYDILEFDGDIWLMGQYDENVYKFNSLTNSWDLDVSKTWRRAYLTFPFDGKLICLSSRADYGIEVTDDLVTWTGYTTSTKNGANPKRVFIDFNGDAYSPLSGGIYKFIKTSTGYDWELTNLWRPDIPLYPSKLLSALNVVTAGGRTILYNDGYIFDWDPTVGFVQIGHQFIGENGGLFTYNDEIFTFDNINNQFYKLVDNEFVYFSDGNPIFADAKNWNFVETSKGVFYVNSVIADDIHEAGYMTTGIEVETRPELPTTDGNYVYKCTVTNGRPYFFWEVIS